MIYEVALTQSVNGEAIDHLLQHFRKGRMQEDLCFALWLPSTGSSRQTAIIDQVIVPSRDERILHGGASFTPDYLARAVQLAVRERKGLAFMHSHPTKGWQGMSDADVVAEGEDIVYPASATRLPLVGLTAGSDGYWSARFWHKEGRSVQRTWCTKVRVIGDKKYTLYFNESLMPKPKRKEALRRTYDSWGSESQDTIARLHVGVVGLGSVGALVAEALARMGTRRVTFVDPDVVKTVNLDRLINAAEEHIGRHKVDLAKESFRAHATAGDPEVISHPVSVHAHEAFKAVLDCDFVFCCADRPVGRDVLNFVAQAHCIPVVDGGVDVQRHPIRGELFAAHWRALASTPVNQCLRCCGQYTSSGVTADLDGSLDDPRYISNLPPDQRPRNENVFPFTLYVTGMFVDTMLRFMLSTPSWPTVTHQHYVFVQAELDHERGKCKDYCDFRARRGMGDRAVPPYLTSDVEEGKGQRPDTISKGSGALAECVRWVRSAWLDLQRRLPKILGGEKQ